MTGVDRSDADDLRAIPGRWVLFLLIVLMCGVEAAIWALGLWLGGPGATRGLVLEYLAFWPGLLGNWRPNYPLQPYAMFVTYGFVHGSLLHLAVNMIALWSVGLSCLQRVGPAKFAVIYAVSLVGGAAAFGVLAADLTPMVGASGALFGLVGAILAWEYVDRAADAMPLWPVLRAIAILVALNVVLWWAMNGLLAWQTHLGGFLAGWLAALLLDRREGPR